MTWYIISVVDYCSMLKSHAIVYEDDDEKYNFDLINGDLIVYVNYFFTLSVKVFVMTKSAIAEAKTVKFFEIMCQGIN